MHHAGSAAMAGARVRSRMVRPPRRRLGAPRFAVRENDCQAARKRARSNHAGEWNVPVVYRPSRLEGAQGSKAGLIIRHLAAIALGNVPGAIAAQEINRTLDLRDNNQRTVEEQL